MRVSARSQQVSIAQNELRSLILRFSMEHDLTEIELLQALTEAMQGSLKYMLRAERNPEHPDRPADVDYSEEDDNGEDSSSE